MTIRPLHFLLLLFPLYLLFHGLSDFGLLNNVEGMYAEIAREMLVGGDWIIPHLNDVPYIEKPPLLYWLTAAFFYLFGPHDWVARLVPACASLFLLAAVFRFAARVKNRRFAVMAAFMLGTCSGFIMMSTVGMTDALLTAFLNAALLATYIGLVYHRKTALRTAAACLALAVMTKGLVALLLYGLVGIVHIVLFRRCDWRVLLQELLDVPAIALFFLMAAPWHIAASYRLPEFGWFYFVNEHLYRFLGIREPHDYYSGSIFYHLPRLGLMFLPWILLLPGTLAVRRPCEGQDRELKRFLGCCALVPLVFFSLSSAKANYYTVVCLPALSLLTALAVEQWLQKDGTSQLARRVWAGLFIFGLVTIPAESFMLHYVHDREADFSARTMAACVQENPEHLPIFMFQDYEDYSALPFYLQTTVGIIDSRSDDLRFGQRLGAGRQHFVSSEEFLRRRDSAWVLVLDSRLDQFTHSSLIQRATKQTKIGRATLFRFA